MRQRYSRDGNGNIGLLAPAFIEKFTGYRYYTSEQLPILHQILALREMGFTLDEIKQVQGGVPEKELLQKKKLEIIKKIATDTLRLAQVESYLAKKDGDPRESYIDGVWNKDFAEDWLTEIQFPVRKIVVK